MTNEEATIDRMSEANSGGLMAALHEAQPTHPPAPNRKPRSDKGISKKSLATGNTVSIVSTLPIEVAMRFARDAHKEGQYQWVVDIYEQIITQLQKRIDALQKAK